MYIIPLAWLYVTLMMAIAEGTNTNGTVLGAIITFVLYGLLPIALVMYFLGTPGRKRAIRAREQAELEALARSKQPDAGSHSTTDTVPPVRKEP